MIKNAEEAKKICESKAVNLDRHEFENYQYALGYLAALNGPEGK